jgi:Fe-S cluster assembly scaffold protein SufB
LNIGYQELVEEEGTHAEVYFLKAWPVEGYHAHGHEKACKDTPWLLYYPQAHYIHQCAPVKELDRSENPLIKFLAELIYHEHALVPANDLENPEQNVNIYAEAYAITYVKKEFISQEAWGMHE